MRRHLRRALRATHWALYTSPRLIDLPAIARRKGVAAESIIATLRRAPDGAEHDWARRTLRLLAFRAQGVTHA